LGIGAKDLHDWVLLVLHLVPKLQLGNAFCRSSSFGESLTDWALGCEAELRGYFDPKLELGIER
jgi:hypothetical protein